MLILTIVVVVVALATLATTGFIVAARRRPTRNLPEVAPRIPPIARGEAARGEAEASRGEAARAAPAPPGAPGPATREQPEVGRALEPDSDLEAELEAELEVGPALEPDSGLEDVLERVEVAAPEDRPPRFRERMTRARTLLGGYLGSVRARGKIDESTWDELEEALILADVGVLATTRLIDGLRIRVKSGDVADAASLIAALRGDLIELLAGDRELHMTPEGMTVWLFVGVNGVGKTTTIGKVGLREVSKGHRVVMAAGDTFRAAAADQLETWAQRTGASVVRGNEGGDPGAVVFDAVQHAAARGFDLVLADTAGRLHTKTNLMEELKKVRRVAERPPGVVAETLLVVDATTGQNGLVQARQFASAVGVTGVVLTKLDGTAKGGIVIAISEELGIPIKLVGLGEGPGDLVEFNAEEFVDALLPEG